MGHGYGGEKQKTAQMTMNVTCAVSKISTEGLGGACDLITVPTLLMYVGGLTEHPQFYIMGLIAKRIKVMGCGGADRPRSISTALSYRPTDLLFETLLRLNPLL